MLLAVLLPAYCAVLRALLCEVIGAWTSEHRLAPVVSETSLMTRGSHVAQVVIFSDSADSLMREGIIVDLVVLEAFHHCGLQATLDTVAELRTLSGTQITM